MNYEDHHMEYPHPGDDVDDYVSGRGQEWWDSYFLALAEYVSSASRDPSTKVGAVIVRPDKTVASMGFNGFPRGFPDRKRDYENRETKYKFIVHAEANAIATAREPLQGYTLYTWPLPVCSDCCKLAIQSGIRRFVSFQPSAGQLSRWGESFRASERMILDCGLSATWYDENFVDRFADVD